MNERYLDILRALLPYGRIEHERSGWQIDIGYGDHLAVDLWEVVYLGHSGFIARGWDADECYVLTEAGRLTAQQPL